MRITAGHLDEDMNIEDKVYDNAKYGNGYKDAKVNKVHDYTKPNRA